MYRVISLLLILMLSVPLVCRAEITLALNKSFVKKIKDRATVTTTFKVDEKHTSPNSVGKGAADGDIHIAGRDSLVFLPMVAEIINGRLEKDTMAELLGLSTSEQVDVVGVWRLWFEHPGHEDQTQGETVPKPKNTNPDHVFELHPLVEFAGFDCRDSFLPIVNPNSNPPKEYEAFAASVAFPKYEKLEVTVTRSNTAIMIRSGKAGNNYAEFNMRLTGKPKAVEDGFIVFAEIFDVDNNEEPVIEDKKRMIFVKNTPPADAVKNLKKGDILHVVGIPRVNLNRIFAIAEHLTTDEQQDEPLPYEMIIVSVIEDEDE
jgi:hypothetical protein